MKVLDGLKKLVPQRGPSLKETYILKNLDTLYEEYNSIKNNKEEEMNIEFSVFVDIKAELFLLSANKEIL